MGITEHAIKRFALLTMDHHARLEVLFMHRFILPGTIVIRWTHGLHVDDIPLFAQRCHNFSGKMLGLETWPDSPYPLYTYAYEDFSDVYNLDWFQPAIVELKRTKVLDMIIPTVSFPKQALEKYMG